jgi:hypothetical protein
VCGTCQTLTSLNLSRNSITTPFALPIPPSELTHLNLSYNKIPYYHLKEFLKIPFFPTLKQLTLDRISLHGDLSPVQHFIEHSLSLKHLSFVDCDLSV